VIDVMKALTDEEYQIADDECAHFMTAWGRTGVLSACRDITERLEAFWRGLGRSGSLKDFVDSASPEDIRGLKDDRLIAAFAAEMSMQAASANLRMGRDAIDQWEEHLSYAWYCLGIVESSGPQMPEIAARIMGNLRHRETNECKREVLAYWNENKHLYPGTGGHEYNKSAAAEAMTAMKLVPVPYSTIRNWLKDT